MEEEYGLRGGRMVAAVVHLDRIDVPVPVPVGKTTASTRW